MPPYRGVYAGLDTARQQLPDSVFYHYLNPSEINPTLKR